MGEVSPHRFRPSPAELPKLDQLVLGQYSSSRRAALVLALLRRTALEKQSDHFQLFYSIRAVADRFGLPPATVSRMYRLLSSERLLRTVWGSKTLLEPNGPADKRKPRHIGIPVDLCRFTSSPDYQHLVLKLQREIWNHGIAEHFLFFEDCDEEILHLCKRQHFCDLDTVIWVLPEGGNKQTLLRLADLGMRVICIGDTPISGIRDYQTISTGCSVGKIVREKILNI